VERKPEDLELINQARKGDQQAFAGLVRRYESLVARTVIGMLGNVPEADDVGQEVFIRFYHAMDKFRGDAALGTYLVRIAINLSLNELKKRKKVVDITGWQGTDYQVEDMMAGEDEPGKADAHETVHKALETLEPKFRSVVVLRMIEGYDTKETAEILEIPLGTVLSRLTRAQKQLRKVLDNVTF